MIGGLPHEPLGYDGVAGTGCLEKGVVVAREDGIPPTAVDSLRAGASIVHDLPPYRPPTRGAGSRIRRDTERGAGVRGTAHGRAAHRGTERCVLRVAGDKSTGENSTRPDGPA